MKSPLGVKSNYGIMTEYPECTQDGVEYMCVYVWVCVCVLSRATSLALSVIEKHRKKRRTAQLDYQQHTEAEERKQSQWSILHRHTFLFAASHSHRKKKEITSCCMNPSKHTKDGEWHVKSRITLTRHCQNSTEQSEAGGERSRGWPRTRGEEKKRKKKKRKAGMDKGRGDFKAPFFPSAADAGCRSPILLPHLWFSSSFSPWLLPLFPPAAALRQGVENKRYNALPLSLSLAAPSPPFFLPPSLAHPVHSMPYFLCCLWHGTHTPLFTVCSLSLHMNEFKGKLKPDSDLGMMRIYPFFLLCSPSTPTTHPFTNSG